MPQNFTTPVGRIVQGDAFTPSDKDQQGNLRVHRSGPDIGKPQPQWFVALAIPKTDPAWPAFKAMIDAEARAAWPSLHPNGGPCVIPTFSNKIVDGDGHDAMGKANSTKEGFAGCWIIRLASNFPPRVFLPNGPGVWVETADKSTCKRGFYVRAAGVMKGNDQPTKPGLYLNLGMIEVIGAGPEIVSGPDAATAFGQTAALPPGATPLAAPGGPVAPAPPAPPPAPPPPAPPYAGFMPTTHQMLPKAAGATYEAMVAQGWTDALLIEHGMMAAPVTAPPPAPPAPPAAPPPPPPAAPPAPTGPVMTAAATATYDAYIAAGWTDATLRAAGLIV